MLIRSPSHIKQEIAFYEEGKKLTNFRKTEYWKRIFLILYIDNYKENESVFFNVFKNDFCITNI